MSLLFRSSERDRETLQTTVRSLHETTVAGLAAALSWRTRKVERLLVEELTRPGTSMAYDPARRVVRWAPPVSVMWSAPPPESAAPPAPPPKVDLGPALAAPTPVLRSGGLRSDCPSCHVPLVADSSPSLNVCPQCGRLYTSRAATGNPARTDSSDAAPPAPENPTPLEAMTHRLATPEGKKLYARRKHTPEPVFGIIKSVLGFRQFLLRGLDKVRGEWSLVTMAWNIKRIFALDTR